MLRRLSIRNIVLIEALDLDLAPGMTALTGETGAGKSILLDALGLALGERSDAGLIRAGADSASVTAEFESVQASVWLDELGLESEGDQLILRRTLGRDGKSRAFLNDQPVGITTLKTLAGKLIEIEGQFGVHALLERERHRALLDRFGTLTPQRDKVALAWASWRLTLEVLQALEQQAANAGREETFLREAAADLRRLAPVTGEEDELLARRTRLQSQDKLREGLTRTWDALSGDGGAELKLADAGRALQRLIELLPAAAPTAIAALDRAGTEITEAVRLVEIEQAGQETGETLETVEDRLYALRAAARKYQTTIAELPALAAEYEARLNSLDDNGMQLSEARKAVAAAQAKFEQAADALSAARKKAATQFDKLVAAELAPLKLDRAIFTTDLANLPLEQAGEHGRDQVTFTVAINPGAPATPLHKTASGGELARLLLALKVVLAGANPVDTLIFDEADTGLGGATAAAVGERLARLSATMQIVAITHSPQVAAQATTQWRIAKSEVKKAVITSVKTLDGVERREEIARMLAGNAVTDAARAAADALLTAGQTAPAKPKRKAG